MSNEPPVALVTGTSRGIGRFLAGHLAGKGMRVVGCSRQDGAGLDLPNYQHFVADVTDEKSVQQMIHAVRNQFGRLDILINNAGVAAMNHFLLMPTDTARRLLEVNVLGTFIVTREAARLMQKNKYGRIVNLGSVAVPMKIEGEAMYAASKSAVVSFTQIIARELAPFNITCNVMSLPPIETDLIKGVAKEKITRIVNQMAIKRLGRFEDVAHVVDFLTSPSCDYVTGQNICLGGAG